MRKRGKSSAGGSLDSLLDTMTNVVGILIIILILTQLGAGEAVKRISEQIPEITAKEFELAEQQAVDLKNLLEELGEKKATVEAQMPTDPDQIKQQQQAVKNLKKDLDSLLKANVDLDEIKKSTEQLRTRVTDVEKQLNTGEQTLANLKAALDDTPEPGPAPAPKTVYLPNPRPAPKEAEAVTFICRGGRIMYLDIDELKKLAAIAVRGVQARGEKDTVDCSRLGENLDKRNIGDRRFRLKSKAIGGYLYFVPEPREDAGDTAERVGKPTSQFQGILKRANSNRQYIDFLVWADSFDVYLAARKVASDRDFAAGWTPYEKNAEWRFRLDVTVTCSDQPPPPKPKTPPQPQPAQPTRPPLPADVID